MDDFAVNKDLPICGLSVTAELELTSEAIREAERALFSILHL
jgi:hypothetical protein